MSVWITQESAKMVSASTQMVLSAANVHLVTIWIIPESNVLVSNYLKHELFQVLNNYFSHSLYYTFKP